MNRPARFSMPFFHSQNQLNGKGKWSKMSPKLYNTHKIKQLLYNGCSLVQQLEENYKIA